MKLFHFVCEKQLLNWLRSQWDCGIRSRGVIETMESFTKMFMSDPTVSLRSWKPISRSHWNRGNQSRGLIETAETNPVVSAESVLCKWLSRITRRIRSHMQNCFSPWIRALGDIVWWKKTKGQKCSKEVSQWSTVPGSLDKKEGKKMPSFIMQMMATSSAFFV
jgi:hypothetical protein